MMSEGSDLLTVQQSTLTLNWGDFYTASMMCSVKHFGTYMYLLSCSDLQCSHCDSFKHETWHLVQIK